MVLTGNICQGNISLSLEETNFVTIDILYVFIRGSF